MKIFQNKIILFVSICTVAALIFGICAVENTFAKMMFVSELLIFGFYLIIEERGLTEREWRWKKLMHEMCAFDKKHEIFNERRCYRCEYVAYCPVRGDK